MTAKEHNNLFGIFVLIQGGLLAFGGVFMTLIYGGIGVAMLGNARKEEEQIVGGVLMGVGMVIGVIVLLMSALYFFTGIKIRKQQSIGRTLGIVLSVLSLFSIPLGTALGIYGLWFFLGDLGKGLYLGQGSYAANAPYNPQGPGPNSWQ
jgi:hypothetical protein